MLQSIKTAQAFESKTNPRGKEFEGKSFDELVASIKEKGVLVPVLARAKTIVGTKEAEGKAKPVAYEIVAGNRRLRAAKKAGLTEIPAQIVEMTDDEAREAQIVENLQREDVHPLEEGEAYRQLIEQSKLEIDVIAARVGKTESYVKQRLYLTNLEEKPKAAYRGSKINDGHAVLIARLSPGDQLAALKATTDRYNSLTVKELKEWIEVHIYSPMDSQPWLSISWPKEEMAKLVGACIECKPERASLFGNAEAGACTDLKCWTRKMAAYIAYRARADKLLKVSAEYGLPPKGAKGRDEYVVVAKNGKDRCDSVEGAIAVDGAEIGEVFEICADKECTTHFAQRSNYRQSPTEQAKRKKEREREEAKRQKFDLAISAAVCKVSFPLSAKHLDALLDIALADTSTSYLMPICKRHGLKGAKSKDGGRDYRTPLRELAENAEENGKLRMIFELMLPTYNQYGDDSELKKRTAKL